MTTLKRDVNKQCWETNEFPILCQSCLGNNAFMRMTKEKFGKECKICTRPFTIFRWCPGARMRFKKTEICLTCARLKNVCQTCLLDLEFSLPVQVRDSALQLQDEVPTSHVNREFFVQNMERQLAAESGEISLYGGSASGSLVSQGEYANKAPKASAEILSKLRGTAPYYDKNLAHICSFYLKGDCRRGKECPYRHARPRDPDDPLSKQNIKDRYHGVNDPVAKKLLDRMKRTPEQQVPDDKSITTLYVGGLNDTFTESDLRDYFYQFGEIKSITIIHKQLCAFVTYSTREAAEEASAACFSLNSSGGLVIKDKKLRVMWGKTRNVASQPKQNLSKTPEKHTPSDSTPLLCPPPSQQASSNCSFLYPSQNPSRMGSGNEAVSRS